MIKAFYKKNRSKMILSVPECAVRRAEEDVSTVIPKKYNPNDNSTKKIIPKVFSMKTESVSKKDNSTQTYSPNALFH